MFPSCLGDPGSDVALLLESLGIYILDCLGDDVAFLLERLVILDGIGERSARLLESLCTWRFAAVFGRLGNIRDCYVANVACSRHRR